MLPTEGREPEPTPLSVEPLSASVDLLMKRMAPTLRFPIRKPRSPQTGLSPVVHGEPGGTTTMTELVTALLAFFSASVFLLTHTMRTAEAGGQNSKRPR
jgi:hypothetical protein